MNMALLHLVLLLLSNVFTTGAVHQSDTSCNKQISAVSSPSLLQSSRLTAAPLEVESLKANVASDAPASENELVLMQMSASASYQARSRLQQELRAYTILKGRRDSTETHWRTFCNILGAVVGVCLLLGLVQFLSDLSSKQTEGNDAKQAGRSCLLDNARGFASTTVVFVHLTGYFLEQLFARQLTPTGEASIRTTDVDTWLSGCMIGDGHLGSDLQSWFMTAARQFDMPIFCFVSGLCSQGPTNRKRLISFVTGIIAPWLLFRLVAEPFLYNPLRDLSLWNVRDFGNPHPVYDDWYMVALIVWKAVTLTFSRTNPYVLCIAMMVASFTFEYLDLTVSWAPFAFTRTFKFLPYYAIGYVWPRQTILQAPSFSGLDVTQRFQACCLLGFGAFLMLPFWMDIFGTDFSDTFTSTDQFAGMPADFVLAWIQIIARVTKNMMVMIPMMVFVMPKDETIFTSIGRLTLYPYFLHRILLEHRLTFITQGPPPVWTSPVSHCMVYLGHYVFCVAVCMLLTSAPVRMLFGWAIEPKWLDRLIESILPEEEVSKPAKVQGESSPVPAQSSVQKIA